MQARRTDLIVFVNGTDISTTVGGYIQSLSYTDNEEDEADDLQITMDDKDRKWLGWLETARGAELRAMIRQRESGGNGGGFLDCGAFELDAPGYGGPPAKVTLKGTSLPHTSSVRSEARTKAWENVPLSAIAKETAKSNGLVCMFESSYDPFYTRREQIQTSDIVFLQRLCNNAGISLKATDKILVLFQQKDYEAKGTVRKIVYGESDVLKYKFKQQTNDCDYARCHVTYTDPQSGETIESAFSAPGATGNQTLVVNEKVSSTGEAESVAQARLRDKNKERQKAEFTLSGDIRLVAGVTVVVEGWGLFDGKYIIEKAKHSVSGSGYTVQINVRLVLEGY
ncbi:MAG: hypothetical protein FWC70_10065 [Defluviitaleaceae bacterium]|nr:hypothetical protein [Defluviitaleaceae bacterium]